MERLRRVCDSVTGLWFKLYSMEPSTPRKRKERIESVANFIEKTDPQKSIKVVCDGEEVLEIVEGIGRGFQRLEEKKAKKE